MKKFETVDSLSFDIALRKHRAGQARFGRGGTFGEKPRDVFNAACGEVANQLAPDGFTFKKSAHSAKRKHGDFTDEIWFQSSHNNVAGQYVALWIHANVHSDRMNDWRAAHPYPGSIVHDSVGADQIGNLRTPSAWLEWNLAVDRDAQIRRAVEQIRELAFPFFRLFENPDALASELTERQIPGIDLWRSIEFLLCFASREMAQRAIASFFKRRPELFSEYKDAVRRFAVEGVPDYLGSGYAKDLAKATIVFGLTPPSG
jgi:hypothetical protein